MSSGSRRLGREGSIEALLTAAREMFAERGPDAVSLRDVARRAGVSHGLIHHYIGSRDDLLRMVFDRATATARDELDGAADPQEALVRLRRMGGDDDETARLLAWSILEGRDPAVFHGRSSALDAIVSAGSEAGPDEHEQRLAVAAAMVQVLGVKLFGRYALTAAGLEDADLPQLRDLLAGSSDALVEQARPSGARR